jgi:hypothetical protein
MPPQKTVGEAGWKHGRAVSPVISTVIISATLLVILVISSFTSTNILELQIVNTEFEQAKTNMLLLNKMIQDVALKQGSAGSIQFSQRSGGICIYESTEKISIRVDSVELYPFDPSVKFYTVKYRGGSGVSAAEVDLAGSPSLIVGMAGSLGYLRVETGDGVWMVLDYLRLRVVTNTVLKVGSVEYNLTNIFIIRLELGPTGGSGTVTVRVQNMGFTTKTYVYETSSITLQIDVGSRSEAFKLTSSGKLVVAITEAVVRVSIA